MNNYVICVPNYSGKICRFPDGRYYPKEGLRYWLVCIAGLCDWNVLPRDKVMTNRNDLGNNFKPMVF